jgi:hypothetical protein
MYFEMLQDRMAKLDTIFHILVRRLIILRRPKVDFTLLFIVILKMDFCTCKVDAHNTSITTCSFLFFGGYKRKCLEHSTNGC